MVVCTLFSFKFFGVIDLITLTLFLTEALRCVEFIKFKRDRNISFSCFIKMYTAL